VSVDLLKLLILLAGMWGRGTPDSWDVAAQVRLTLAIPGPTGAVELAVDPVPIYYRPLEGYCGLFTGVILVDPDHARMGCQNTLRHELNHAWQLRTWGLLYPISYLANPDYWESDPQPAPRSLNWPLIRVWLPLDPGGERR
jgi:hypothetical protein